jgi:hypothetical protein
MSTKKIVLVFVHGWSVTNTDTYGDLPERIKLEAKQAGINVLIKEIFLGKYISFHDEVKLSDISYAFEQAIQDSLSPLLKYGTRFACITHSTGGPVVREWWHRFYLSNKQFKKCPMSHLIMLAPANYGSALAQLGKGRLSRMKFWFGGVEPGQGVLNWLELGSDEAWDLNTQWIQLNEDVFDKGGVFPFVLTGQSIDHKLYDNLNTYTGESGSDGVVRVAAANLAGQYLLLEQQKPKKKTKKRSNEKTQWLAPNLMVKLFKEAIETPLCILAGKSHSGKRMGIMRSIKKMASDKKNKATVAAIIESLQVKTLADYKQLTGRFAKKTQEIQTQESLEIVDHLLLPDSYFIHDRYAMVVFRVRDQEGYPITDYDLILTAGKENDPNHLPQGFFADKQRNTLHPEIITYYFNYDMMVGSKAILKDNDVIRGKTQGVTSLGLQIIPRPSDGFVRYLPCEIKASRELLKKVLRANTTTLVDICLQRVVCKNVMTLDKGTKTSRFSRIKPSNDIV